ncbi:MAG: tRNA (N6-threonylcarbamoyladenosine(37)-N6)-methyltransferase TrmO [Chloroflexota bacterium]|nr:tRNA (N6-threonylcarbamoyladenosine(37)-N6)-methyltransferase TrmO [Chloroflexota bacterium]
MSTGLADAKIDEVIGFHGHWCPGVTTGIRVAEVALREMGHHAADEEIVAVVETDNCAVDAIQYLTGCTFGKGNLVHLDHGQNIFTFARRSDGKALRIVCKSGASRALSAEEEALVERARTPGASPQDREDFAALWRRRAQAILEADEGELLVVERLDDYEIPGKAELHPSIRCEECGQMTMSTRIFEFEGRSLCIKCYRRAVAEREDSCFVFEPIGVVENDWEPHAAPPRNVHSRSKIKIEDPYIAALEGIEESNRLQILFCFDRAPQKVPLQQHPRGNRDRPKRGVFALRSPHRPNAIGLTTVEVLAVQDDGLVVSGLDAWNGTPVLDIKPYVKGLDED